MPLEPGFLQGVHWFPTSTVLQLPRFRESESPWISSSFRRRPLILAISQYHDRVNEDYRQEEIEIKDTEQVFILNFRCVTERKLADFG